MRRFNPACDKWIEQGIEVSARSIRISIGIDFVVETAVHESIGVGYVRTSIDT